MNDEASIVCAEGSNAARSELEDDLYWEEIEADIEWDDQRFDWLLNLIAWTCRQKADPKPLSQAGNWPIELIQGGGEYDPYEDKVLRWLAFKDPIFFDLARAQTAELVEWEDDALCREDLAFIAKLLRAEHPPRRVRTGDNFGRDSRVALGGCRCVRKPATPCSHLPRIRTCGRGLPRFWH